MDDLSRRPRAVGEDDLVQGLRGGCLWKMSRCLEVSKSFIAKGLKWKTGFCVTSLFGMRLEGFNTG